MTRQIRTVFAVFDASIVFRLSSEHIHGHALVFISHLTAIFAFQGHDERRRLPREPMLKAAGTAVSVVRLPRVREPGVGLRRSPALHTHERRGLANGILAQPKYDFTWMRLSNSIQLKSLAKISN